MMFTRTSRVKTKEKGDSFEYAINFLIKDNIMSNAGQFNN